MRATTSTPPKIPSFFQALRCECGRSKGVYCDGTHLGFAPRERCADDAPGQAEHDADPRDEVRIERS
jgi:CDGSH-type Zn-finger protein